MEQQQVNSFFFFFFFKKPPPRSFLHIWLPYFRLFLFANRSYQGAGNAEEGNEEDVEDVDEDVDEDEVRSQFQIASSCFQGFTPSML